MSRVFYFIGDFIIASLELSTPGADCNLGPTWEQNFLFQGQLEMFPGRSVQCHFQFKKHLKLLPMACCYKLNGKNPSYQTWESLVLIFKVPENNTLE